MATGTTITIATRHDKDYRQSCVATDAGSPVLGSPTFIYDDAENQEDLILAVDKLKAYLTANVTIRTDVTP